MVTLSLSWDNSLIDVAIIIVIGNCHSWLNKVVTCKNDKSIVVIVHKLCCTHCELGQSIN